MVLAQDHERHAARAEQVLVRGDEQVVEPVDDVVKGHERDAMRGVEEDLRAHGLGPLDDLPNRQHQPGLHLHEADRDQGRAGRDGVQDRVDLVDLDELHPTLLRHEERVQDGPELGGRRDDAVAGLECRATTPTPTETAGSRATRPGRPRSIWRTQPRARSDWRSHSTQPAVPACHASRASRMTRIVESGGSPYVAVSR